LTDPLRIMKSSTGQNTSTFQGADASEVRRLFFVCDKPWGVCAKMPPAANGPSGRSILPDCTPWVRTDRRIVDGDELLTEARTMVDNHIVNLYD